MTSIELIAIPNFPLIEPGDDVAEQILETLAANGQSLRAGDILVIAQKIVSKAEGRLVRLADVEPSERAQEIAAVTDKDPRAVQVVLDDSNEVIRVRRGLLVAEQRHGWLCANAGVDRSNVAQENSGEDGESDVLALLPLNGDASATAIRTRLALLRGQPLEKAPPVLINDSHGRPWRVGTVGVCIGCDGLPPLWNQNGLSDLYGYQLHASEECIADELCAAASLLMGQSNEAIPVVIVRGYALPPQEAAPAKVIQRPAEMDAFR